MKKIRNCFCLLSFIILSYCLANAQESKERYYGVINAFIDRCQITNLSKKSFNIIDPIKNPNAFNEFVEQIKNTLPLQNLDTNYMKEQLTLISIIKWKKSDFSRIIHLRLKATDYVSTPLFLNRDNSVCIIYHRQYVGPLDASGFYEIYQKENSSWKFLDLILLWIS
jgi:hypothetical protein